MLDRNVPIPVPTFLPPNEVSFSHGVNASPFYTIVELVSELTIRAARVMDTAMRVRETVAMRATAKCGPIEGFVCEGMSPDDQRDITDLIDELNELGDATSSTLTRLTRCAPEIISQWALKSEHLVDQIVDDGDDLRMLATRLVMQLLGVEEEAMSAAVIDTMTHEAVIDGGIHDDDDLFDDDLDDEEDDDFLSCGEGCECAAAAKAQPTDRSDVFELHEHTCIVTDSIPGAKFMFLVIDPSYQRA